MPSPSFLYDVSAAQSVLEPTRNSLGRAVKRSANAKQAKRPAKRRKVNGSEAITESSEEEQNAPEQQDQEDPYAHLRPTFERFWSEDASPILPAAQEQPEHEGGELYFAYGKDMDETYLFRLFSSSNLPEPAFKPQLGNRTEESLPDYRPIAGRAKSRLWSRLSIISACFRHYED
jgi:hypothetical protein